MAADVLHKAEHRSYRELAVVVRQMLEHWGQLGRWLPASHGAAAMTAGADVARRLLGDIETHLQRYEVSLRPGSQALGGGLGLVRRQVADRFLERNQALRTAALEAHHVTMLLDFLAHVARTRADQTAQQFCERWHKETASVAEGASRAAAHMGDPDLASARRPVAAGQGRASRGGDRRRLRRVRGPTSHTDPGSAKRWRNQRRRDDASDVRQHEPRGRVEPSTAVASNLISRAASRRE